MTTHLIMSYTPGDVATPHAACRAAGPQGAMVDIYSGGDESAIDCEGCLTWLNDGDNRMLLLDVGEWIRKHAADEDLRYIDRLLPQAGD